MCQRDVGGHPEVDQAGDLVHSDGRETVYLGSARVHRAEESARFVVPLEGVCEDAIALRLGKLVQVEGPATRVVARTPLECRERPRVALEQIHGAAQVLGKWLLYERLHFCLVVPEEGVQHQRYAALAGMTRLPPSLSVERELGAKFLDALAQQVGQDSRTKKPSLSIRLRSAGGRKPYRQFRLYRSRQGTHGYQATIHARQFNRFATPQPTHDVDTARHDCLVVGVGLRPQNEVVRLPPRGECHARTAA